MSGPYLVVTQGRTNLVLHRTGAGAAELVARCQDRRWAERVRDALAEAPPEPKTTAPAVNGNGRAHR